jgi:hypothetical protein
MQQLKEKYKPKDVLEYAARVASEHPHSLGLALVECKAALPIGDSGITAVSVLRRAAEIAPRDAKELSSLVRYLDLMREVAAGLGRAPLPTPEDVLGREFEVPSLARDAKF